ncbi:MAG: hypothetical protein OHK0013_33370 [Sandaracinaceae bacterium]
MSASWKVRAMGLGIAAIGGLTGCGSSDGVVTADLEYVDSSIVSRHDLFLDPTLDNRPMTIAQLGGERASAIPVDIEIFGRVAVAWRRSELGVELPRNADNLVSLWRVHDVADGSGLVGATPIAGELERGPDYQPGDSDLPRVDGVDIERPGDRVATGEEGLYILIDWIDRASIPSEEDLELARELAERHPGCLE